MSSSVMPAPVQATSAAIQTKGRSVAQGILRRTTSSANSTSWSLFSHKTVEVGGEFMIWERLNDGGCSVWRMKHSKMKPPHRATPPQYAARRPAGAAGEVRELGRMHSIRRLLTCRACSSSSRADHWRANSACVSDDLLTSLPALRRLRPVLYYGWIDAGSTSNLFLSLVGVARSEPIGF